MKSTTQSLRSQHNSQLTNRTQPEKKSEPEKNIQKIAKAEEDFTQIEDFSMYNEDLVDQIQSFYQHASQIKRAYPELKINQILNFKNDVDDIVGFELDELIYYITKVHSQGKTKKKYTFKELMETVLPKYAAYSTKMREEGKDNYYLKFTNEEGAQIDDDEENETRLVKDQNGEYQLIAEDFLGKDMEPLEEERVKIRNKGMEIFQMKIDKHFDKIKEIFEQSCSKDKINWDNNQNQTEEMKQEKRMKLSKLRRLLDDIAYVCGLVFIYYERYLSQGIVDTRTQKEVIKQLKHKLWLEAHDEQIKEYNKQKQQTLLNQEFDGKSRKSSPIQSQKSHRSSVKPKIRSIMKQGQINFEEKISDDPGVLRTQVVKFEDQLYQQEKNKTLVNYDTVIRVLERWFEENENVIALDANHEYDSLFKQQEEQEKHVNDENFDPFIDKLQEQISRYELMLNVNQPQIDYPPLNTPPPYQFKTPKEKEIIECLYSNVKEQLQNYLKEKQALIKFQEMKSQNYETLAEMQNRALRQIFSFYTGQHWKWNMSFDQLLEKKSLLDFGEFNIFCKDFSVPLPKNRIQIAFKKCSINHKPHEYEQFQKSIDTLGIDVNAYKIEQMEKRLQEISKIERMRQDRQEKKFVKMKIGEDQQRIDQYKQQSLLNKSNNEIISEKDEDEEDKGKDEEIKGEDEEKKEENDKQEEPVEDQQHQLQEGVEEQKSVNQDKIQNEVKADNIRDDTKSRKSFKSFKSVIKTSTPIKSTISEISERTNNRIAFQEQLKNMQDTLYKKEESQLQEPIHIEKQKLQFEVQRLKKIGEHEIIMEFYEFLELHDITKYRKKMRGLKINPFDMRDNYQRISIGELRGGNDYRDKLTAQQIREKVNQMRDKRLREKKVREMREKKKDEDQRVQQSKKYEQNRKKRFVEEAAKLQQIQQIKQGKGAAGAQQLQDQGSMDNQTYMKLRNQSLGLAPEEGRNLKLTLEDLERMNYQDIAEGRADDFKPSLIIQEERKQSKRPIKHKLKDDSYMQGDNTMDEIQRMIVGDDYSPDNGDRGNYSEKLYAVKKERKQQQQQQDNSQQQNKQTIHHNNKQLKIDLNPQLPFFQPPMTERSAYKRGANQPLQKEQQSLKGKSLKRGNTPDQIQSKSRKNQSLNKSYESGKSKKSEKSGKSEVKLAGKRKQSENSFLYKSANDPIKIHSMNRELSVKNLKQNKGLASNNQLVPYPAQRTAGNHKSAMLGVSQSVANLKGINNKGKLLALPAPPQQKGMPQVMNNKYNAQDIIQKAKQIDSKQKAQKSINMANILKMHDKQLEKGLYTARK